LSEIEWELAGVSGEGGRYVPAPGGDGWAL